jgi:alkylresorcinol/alkylpyrone synthase
MKPRAEREHVRIGLLSVASGAPAHELSQDQARRFAGRLFAHDFADEIAFAQLLESFDHAGIRTRQLAVPPEWLQEARSFPEKNEVYVREAVRLSRGVAEQAIVASGIERRDLGAIVFASSTGIATPSLDGRLVQELDLPRTIQRLPIWGLGCAGGSAALFRSLTLARGLGRPVLAVACELCSLTFVHEDRRKANVIAVALFGDGAAACVVAPGPWWTPEEGPELLAGYSRLLDRSEDVMGWDVDSGGLRVRFAPTIPGVVREHTPDIVRAARAAAGLYDGEPIAHWALHPGGRKVLEAYAVSLGLGEAELHHSRSVLRDHGNMSGPTVLFVLERLLESAEQSNSPGLVLGLGPGFCAEGVVFRW